MSDKIKQVAKALRSGMEDSEVVSLVANGPKGEAALEQFFEVLAMDAIEAMREPTDKMLEAAVFPIIYNQRGEGISRGPREAWELMVGAALSRS